MTSIQSAALGSVALLLLAVGCGVNPPPSTSSFGEDARADSIRIHVTNLNFQDARLWALTSGTREKLGLARGKQETVFTISWGPFLDLKIEMDILSGPRCTTEALPVNPGDEIELIIDVDMTHSPLCGGGELR